MAACYWARWACSGQARDLPALMLPYVLEEGYELLSNEPNRQTFDSGGIVRKIAWSLNTGGRSSAPIDLTITYSYLPAQTIANFYWKLWVRPRAAASKQQQASFERQIQQQLARIVAKINDELLQPSLQSADEVALEGASLQAYWEQAQGISEEALDGEPETSTDTASSLPRKQLLLHAAAMHVAEPITCDVCCLPAVPVPGTMNRYFCISCRHQTRYQPGA